ncbi:MAG: SDR family NAD(P)-dependent oxidoreductase, partial [Bacteroidota bacterium]|nr:SDR family NAD(P)-dependent oxidoreductase [Bacteroidota bacterium]
MINLEEQVAVITGGSRGIGAASAVMLAKAGADIVFTYLSNDLAAKQVIDEVTGLGRKCIAIMANIAKPKAAIRVVEKTLQKFGQVDVLINNAGIWTYGEIGKISEETWKETMQVNLDGTFYMINAVVPHMKKRRYGRIINMSSTAGQRGEAF